MKAYYQIFCWSKLFKLWIPHDLRKYSSLQDAKKEVRSYKEHKLGIKFRIIKTEILYEDKK